MQLPWITWLTLLSHLFIIKTTAADGEPGLRRVPKVYNALITSDQNLVPSRAYPVVQPVVHRTAVGYISPYYNPYYTPVGPGYIGPEVYPAPFPPHQPAPGEGGADGPKNGMDNKGNEKELTENEEKDNNNNNNMNKDRVPLSFYPNYQSVYFNPYLYGYNLYPNVAPPGTYYVNYQPPGPPGPLLPPPPPYGIPQPYPGEPTGPNNGDDKKTNDKEKLTSKMTTERTEKVPDVPPPPVPGKRSS